MTEAPEKIWAMPNIDGNWRNGRCTNEHHKINNLTAPFVFEYTPSDIVDELRAKVASLEVYIMQMEDNLYKLEAEVARLKAALQMTVGQKVFVMRDGFSEPHETDASRVARAALAHGEVATRRCLTPEEAMSKTKADYARTIEALDDSTWEADQ
jgi:multidrug resistance efflux pump